jgi:hypothetical protein
MSRRPLRFRQSDLMRAMRAAQRLGNNWGVDILPDGTIRVAPAQEFGPDKALNADAEALGDSPWPG